MNWPPPKVDGGIDPVATDVSQGLMWMFVLTLGVLIVILALVTWAVVSGQAIPGEFWTLIGGAIGVLGGTIGKIGDGLVSQIKRGRDA